MLAGITGSAAAYRSRPGRTQIVSVTTSGQQGSNSARTPSITPDGRYVTFQSLSKEFAPGIDIHNSHQVYVRDLHAGTTGLVSVSNSGEAANEWVTDPAISEDGRFVVFETMATNLVPEKTNSWQIYLYDRELDRLELVSRNAAGEPGLRASTNPHISGDGRWIVFQSYSTNLVAGTEGNRIHVYLFDRQSGNIELISRTPQGAPANHDSKDPFITPDGRYIAYHSHATDLVPEPDGPGHDVFVHDRVTGETDLVSVRSDGAPQDKGADTQTISDDGRYVAFVSSATNLVPSQLWDTFGVYVHDRETGTTERVSVSSDGAESSGGSFDAMISGDGRHVAFMSYGFNLAPEEELNQRPDIFVHDLVTHETEKLTIATDGGPADSDSSLPSISRDGRLVAFETLANNLHPDDYNGRPDIILRDRGPSPGVGELQAKRDAGSVELSGWATFGGAILAEKDTQPLPGLAASDASMTGASVTSRAEREDLLFEIRLEELSSETPLYNHFGRKIGINRGTWVYRWSFTVNGVRWEARIQRLALTGAPDALPYDQHAKLFRCDPVCIPVRNLNGGIGASGPLVRIGVPLDAVGAPPGLLLQDVEASIASGEINAPSASAVALPFGDLEVPVPTLKVGEIGSDDMTWADVTVGPDGGFTHALTPAASATGVVARACLVEMCGDRVVLFDPLPNPDPSPTAPQGTELVFTEATTLSVQHSDPATIEVRLTDASSSPIASKNVHIHFGDRAYAVTTDGDGRARAALTVENPAGQVPVEVVFSGDESYGEASLTGSVSVTQEDAELDVSVSGNGNNRRVLARLSDADSAIGVAARNIVFSSNGTQIGSAVTDAEGLAELSPPPGARGGHQEYEAVFEGDRYFLPATGRAALAHPAGRYRDPRWTSIS